MIIDNSIMINEAGNERNRFLEPLFNSGPFNVYPESATNFFLKISGGQLTFIKNDTGEVTVINLRDDAWLPDGEGKKLKSK